MSTITREFTKEQLIEHVKGRKEFADECAADSTLHPERREYYELTAEALRIALASLEAEAVVFRSKLKPPSAIDSENWDYTDHRQPDAFELESCVIERLYTAPPAPVSVPECFVRFHEIIKNRHHGRMPEEVQIAFDECAAMLQGADGNSPVIPDGWVACSERMPDIGTEIFYFCQDDGLRDCGIVGSSNFSGRDDAQLYVHAEGYDLRFVVDITHWMPLPAPPQK